MTQDWLPRLRSAVEEELGSAVQLRHRLHAHPALSGEEEPTRDLVLASLPAPDGVNKTAETGAIVRIGGTGPAIAVRAELDALPVQEITEVEWRSVRPEVMHACGHDMHLAAVVALARAVHRVGGPVPLLVILQPREETYPSGAQDIVNEGCLEREECRAVIGVHVQPLLERGSVACTPGVVNASSDEFTITIRGVAGHAAYPHLGSDPVLTLSQVIVALQSLVSRRADPMASVVLSVTMLDAGSAPNAIPGQAVARGTIRALDPLSREVLTSGMADTVDLVARAHGCTGHLHVTRGEPTLTNDSRLAEATAPLLGRLGLTATDALRSAGSDDFAYFAERLPSLMLFVGTDGGRERLHSSTFVPPDERVADVAYAMLAGYLAAAGILDGRPGPASAGATLLPGRPAEYRP